MSKNLVPADEEPDFYKAFFNEGIYVINEPELPVYQSTGEKKEVVEELPKNKLLLHGDKMANTLLLFNYPTGTAIPKTEKVFLGDVLKAVNLSFEKVSYLNVTDWSAADFDFLIDLEQVQNIIVFGKNESLSLEFLEGEIHIYHGKKMLCAGLPSAIMENVAQKKLLWDGLKKIFNL